ncbi:hypothetical protein [Microbispora sp. H10830]|uniref:hypothetical protein n=1 Tax=Microbispora sp. H10830 TaxID=2729109 RepID=UPI0037CBD3FF
MAVLDLGTLDRHPGLAVALGHLGEGIPYRLRRIGNGHGARVRVLTTYDTDSDTLPAIDAGATGHLLKHAPRDDLFGAVRGEKLSPPSSHSRHGRTLLSPGDRDDRSGAPEAGRMDDSRPATRVCASVFIAHARGRASAGRAGAV